MPYYDDDGNELFPELIPNRDCALSVNSMMIRMKRLCAILPGSISGIKRNFNVMGFALLIRRKKVLKQIFRIRHSTFFSERR